MRQINEPFTSSDQGESLRERAQRWEAIARQLAEVLERHGSHPRLCLASDVCAVCAALSVYRAAIKETP